MKFGTSADKATQTSGDSNSNWIKYINKDGEWRFRFLEEWEDWLFYWEHFSASKRCSYPCTEDRETCPGCNCGNEKEAKASPKYLVNALYRDPKAQGDGYVNLWKISAGLRTDLVRFMDKAGGTLTDRDYTVIRTTEARTSYSIDREDKEPIDLEQYRPLLKDKQEALSEAFELAWDDSKRAARDKDFEERKAKSKDNKPDVKDEETPFILKSQEERDRLTTEAMEKAGAEHFGTPETVKPALSVVPEPEPEEIKLTVTEIKKMSNEKLLKLYSQAGVEPDSEADHAQLAENLIKALQG